MPLNINLNINNEKQDYKTGSIYVCGYFWKGRCERRMFKVREYGWWTSHTYMKLTKKSLSIVLSGALRGLRGRENGSDLTNTQHKLIWNCHNKSPPVQRIYPNKNKYWDLRWKLGCRSRQRELQHSKTLLETLESHFVEIKHHQESKRRHPEPIAHGKLPRYHTILKKLVGCHCSWLQTCLWDIWQTKQVSTTHHTELPPATPGINQQSPLCRLISLPPKNWTTYSKL
jgi:hypothetical protein